MPRMPHKWYPELQHRFAQAISTGASIKNAAEYVGMSERTAEKWLKRGREAVDRWEQEETAEDVIANDPDWYYAQFFRDVSEARGRFFVNGAAVIASAAFGHEAQYDDNGNQTRAEVVADWKAALELMARRDPAEWGRTSEPAYRSKSDLRAEDEMADLAEHGEALVAELVRANGDLSE